MHENFWQIFAVSVALAVVAALVACIIVIVKYKKKLKSPIYPVERYANLALNVCQDNFLGSTVTRVKISSSNKR